MRSDLQEEDLPILGEPLPVEFANSLYLGDETLDCLETSARATLWFGAAAQGLPRPRRFSADELGRLGELRAIIRGLTLAAVSHEALPLAEVEALNRFASLCPSYAQLALDDQGCAAQIIASVGTIDGLLSRLAHEAIVLLSEKSALLRRCEAPGCPMFFLKNHHRRRWCHNGCGHRSRQAAYYRRHHGERP